MPKDKNNFDPGSWGSLQTDSLAQLKKLIEQDPNILQEFEAGKAEFYAKIDSFVYDTISKEVDKFISQLSTNEAFINKLVEDKIEDLEISGDLPVDEERVTIKAASKFEKIATGKVKT